MDAGVIVPLLVQAQSMVRSIAEDKVPDADDVTAGGWGALMFLFLIVACVVLFISFRKQLRKSDAAKRAGVYGDPPDSDE